MEGGKEGGGRRKKVTKDGFLAAKARDLLKRVDARAIMRKHGA